MGVDVDRPGAHPRRASIWVVLGVAAVMMPPIANQGVLAGTTTRPPASPIDFMSPPAMDCPTATLPLTASSGYFSTPHNYGMLAWPSVSCNLPGCSCVLSTIG